MYNCKEDLKNVWISTSSPHFDLFCDLLERFNIRWANSGDRVRSWDGFKGRLSRKISVTESCKILNYKGRANKEFKPTRTEYEKVTESIFDLRDEFERGELHYQQGGGYLPYKLEAEFAHGFMHGRIYRKVEKEIDEREEFVEKVGNILPIFDKRTNPMWARKLYDAGCRFVGE